jgi:hypothetical protein
MARTASDRIGRFSRSQPGTVVVDRPVRAQPGPNVANPTTRTEDSPAAAMKAGSVIDPTLHATGGGAALNRVGGRHRPGHLRHLLWPGFHPPRGLFSSRCERDHTAVAVPPFISRSVDHLKMRLARRRGYLPQPA